MAYKINVKYPLFLRDINNEKNNIGNGYPAVIIEDNFNIEAKPNIFYHINHDGDDEICINFIDEEFYGYPVVNEFIFNIHSPANITFNKEISWNNNEEPDFTQEGMYTISILAGVGCYTFINT